MKRFLILILASSLLGMAQPAWAAGFSNWYDWLWPHSEFKKVQPEVQPEETEESDNGLSQGELDYENKKLSGEIPNTLQEYEAEQKAKQKAQQAADEAAEQAIKTCTASTPELLKGLVELQYLASWVNTVPEINTAACKQGNARNIFVKGSALLIEPLVLPKLDGAEYFNIQTASGESGKALIMFPDKFEKFTGAFKPSTVRIKNCLIKIESDHAVIKNLMLINEFGPTVCIQAGVKNVTLEGNLLVAPNDQVIWWEDGVTNVTAKNNQFAGKNTAKVMELIQGDYDGIHTATGNSICDPKNVTDSGCQLQEAFLQKKVDGLAAIGEQFKPSPGMLLSPQAGQGAKVPQITSEAQQQVQDLIKSNTEKMQPLIPNGVIPDGGGNDDDDGEEAGGETGTVFPCAEGEALVNNPVLGPQCITLPDVGKDAGGDTGPADDPIVMVKIEPTDTTDTTACTGDVLLDLATNCCDPLTEIYDPKTSSCIPGPTVSENKPEAPDAEVITIGPLVNPPANQGDGGGCTLLSTTHEPSLTVIGLFWGTLALLAALLFRTRPGDHEDTTLHGRHA